MRDTTNCYRLTHGEGDNLPGLIVDIYGETAVVQSHSVGMYLSRQNITEAIKHVYGNQIKAIYDKSEGTLPFKAGLNAKDEYLFGNSIKYRIPLNKSQQTSIKYLNSFHRLSGPSRYSICFLLAFIHKIIWIARLEKNTNIRIY